MTFLSSFFMALQLYWCSAAKRQVILQEFDKRVQRAQDDLELSEHYRFITTGSRTYLHKLLKIAQENLHHVMEQLEVNVEYVPDFSDVRSAVAELEQAFNKVESSCVLLYPDAPGVY